MDFSTRGSQQSPASPRPGASFSGDQPAAAARKSDNKSSDKKRGGLLRWGGWALLIVLALLVLGVIGVLLTSNTKPEDSYVDSSKLQAVFLTNDQVYFGHITNLNNRYVVLTNIYYLQTQNSNSTSSSTTTNNNVSLVKLGCELHKPYDQMVINRSEIEFWENLQADGQVASAVKQYQQQNPNGQKCSNTTNNNASTQNVQGSNTTTNNSSTSNTNNSSSNQ